MFFEGPEKKLEIGLARGDLRSRARSYWEARVQQAGAQILSDITSDSCRAFLLSESSLFVFPRRIVMITCGQTTLVDAARQMLDDFGPDVDYVIYERKNEHFPEFQKTSFIDDARSLSALIPAESWRFGSAHSHRVQLLSSTESFAPDHEDQTLEILMHDIHPDAALMFSEGRPAASKHRQALFHHLFEGFEVDEHDFEPTGYSVNALRGTDYLTIHVTPEKVASYVSFETNLDFGTSPAAWVERVLRVFEPRSLDVVTFSVHPLQDFELAERKPVQWDEAYLPCGYHVSYRHFEQVAAQPRKAYPLSIPKT